MKNFMMVFILLASMQNSAATKMDETVVSKAKYPVVTGLNGSVTITGRDQKPRAAKLNEILKEKAVIETKEKAQIRIELDEKNGIILLASSSLEIPVIGFEFGEVSDLVLKSGQLRVQSLDENERYYATAMTRDLYRNADFLMEYDPARAKTMMTVFRGRLEFRGLENEKSIQLASGEGASFSGVIENGEPAFDVLLKGRKVARGVLSSAVTKIDQEDLAELSEKTLLQKPIKPKGPVKPPKKPGQICEDPNAKLNECVWLCQGMKPKMHLKKCDVSKAEVTCVRRRCNANGLWGDDYTMPTSENRCALKPLVGPCDY